MVSIQAQRGEVVFVQWLKYIGKSEERQLLKFPMCVGTVTDLPTQNVA